MKKIIITVLSAVLLICLFPMSASAEETLKAPTVQYKLINHDEIALRWTEVEGADGYCIYRTDVETGKTVKYKEIVTDTAFNATGLEQNTDYIFKVAAVCENDGRITFGKKSKGTAVTTPYEWYYDRRREIINGERKWIEERRHYNNSGAEPFDISFLYEEFPEDEGDLSFYTFFNINEYVYFKIMYLYAYSEEGEHCICRMKNDGSAPEVVMGIWDDDEYYIIPDPESGIQYIYVIRNETAYSFSGEAYEYEYVLACFDNYIETPPEIYYDYCDWHIHEEIKKGLDSEINLYYYDRDNKFQEKDRWYEEKNVSFAGLGADDEYIYFLSEPLYKITDKTDTTVYRAKLDGSELQKIISIQKDDSFIYGNPHDGSIQVLGCDGDYLYYYLYGKKASEAYKKNNYTTFYRIKIDGKKAVPQKIISVDDWWDQVELCNGYLYIYTSIRDSNGKYSPIYIRIRGDGKDLKKQTEPFEWRY